MGFSCVEFLPHLFFGKKVGTPRIPLGPKVPRAASAVTERLRKAVCNEFTPHGGYHGSQDDRLGLRARSCAPLIPISRSRNPGPSSTRLLSFRTAVVRKTFSLSVLSVVFSLAAAGGIGGGRRTASALLGCSSVVVLRAASTNTGGLRKVLDTQLVAGIGLTGTFAYGLSLGSSAHVWVPVLAVWSALAGPSALQVRGGAVRCQGISAFAIRG